MLTYLLQKVVGSNGSSPPHPPHVPQASRHHLLTRHTMETPGLWEALLHVTTAAQTMPPPAKQPAAFKRGREQMGAAAKRPRNASTDGGGVCTPPLASGTPVLSAPKLPAADAASQLPWAAAATGAGRQLAEVSQRCAELLRLCQQRLQLVQRTPAALRDLAVEPEREHVRAALARLLAGPEAALGGRIEECVRLLQALVRLLSQPAPSPPPAAAATALASMFLEHVGPLDAHTAAADAHELLCARSFLAAFV